MGFTTATVGGKVTAAMYNEHALGLRFYKAVDVAARDAIVGMAAGDYCLVTGTGVEYVYTGSAWVFAQAGNVRVLPTSVAGSGVSLSGTTVVASAATTASANGAFITAFTVYEVDYDLVCSGAATLAFRFRVAGTDSSTGYDQQYNATVNATNFPAQTLNQTSLALDAQAVAGRHNGTLRIRRAATAEVTTGTSITGASANPMASTTGVVQNAMFSHRPLTAYDGFTIFPSTGNITGTITIRGVS